VLRENITSDAEDEYFENRLERLFVFRGNGRIRELTGWGSPRRRSRQGTSTVSPSKNESGEMRVEIEVVVGERKERMVRLFHNLK